MDEITQTIHGRLIESALNRRIIFYDDLSVGIVPRIRGGQWTSILNAINLHESNAGRPLLSALAVRRGYKIPSAGFFTNAHALDRYNAAEGDDTSHAAFWIAEVHRVWDYWAGRANK